MTNTERPENQTRALQPVTTDRALAIPKVNRLLAGVLAPWRAGIRPEDLAIALITEPGSVSVMSRIVRNHPELLKERTGRTPKIEQIEAQFPQIIACFPDQLTDSLLGRFPLLESKVQEEKELLSTLPTPVEIKSITLVLRSLIKRGSGANLTGQDYFEVVEAHELYGILTDRLEEMSYQNIPPEEMERHINIGQRLLESRREFEINPDNFLSDAEVPVTEKDFQGSIAQIGFIGRVMEVIKRVGPNSEEAQHLIESCRGYNKGLIEQLLLRYPHRFPEIARLFEGVEDHGKRSRWVETPGEPEFTPAEIKSNVSHHGND